MTHSRALSLESFTGAVRPVCIYVRAIMWEGSRPSLLPYSMESFLSVCVKHATSTDRFCFLRVRFTFNTVTAIDARESFLFAICHVPPKKQQYIITNNNTTPILPILRYFIFPSQRHINVKPKRRTITYITRTHVGWTHFGVPPLAPSITSNLYE